MRSEEYFYTFLLTLARNFVMASKLLDCKLGAKTLSSEMDCIYKSTRPWNLTGKTVRATAPEGNLTQGEVVFGTVFNSDGKMTLTFKEGFGVSVLNALKIGLGFDVQVLTAKSWATQYPNKSWYGMAQQVIDGEADLSIAKTSILPNRAHALGYLTPTHGMGLYAFFVQPSSKAGRKIFLEPFDTSLWITLLSVYIIIIVSIYAISTIANFTIGLESDDYVLTRSVVIWSCHTLCQHGFHITPKIMCLRIAVITGGILGLILYISYSAHLVSIFSITTVPIKTIEDLLNSKINVIVDQDNQRARNMIEGQNNSTDTDPISSKLILHLKSQKKMLAPAGVGGGSVLNSDGSYSFITFKDSFYTTTKNTFGTGDDEFCQKISAVAVSGAKFKSGLFVKKGGSFFKEAFNIKMIAMYNAGLMGRFVSKYEESYTPRCDGKDQTASTPIIAIPDVIFVFYGLGLGFVLCLMMCLFESFVHCSLVMNCIISHVGSILCSRKSLNNEN